MGETRLRTRLRFLGSSVACALGVLLLLGGVIASGQNGSSGGSFDERPSSSIIGGAILLLGGLAYRSAKKRRLGMTSHVALRKFLEGCFLVVLCAAVLLQKNAAAAVADDPFVNLFVPVWALVAYALIAFWPSRLGVGS